MNNVLRALVIEDSEDDALILERVLQKGGFDFYYKRVESSKELRHALLHEAWDLVLSDYVLPEFGALEALEILKESNINLPFIIVSGKVEEEAAVNAMKAGADDYVTKGNLARLVPVVCRELAEAEIQLRHRYAELARMKSEEKYRHLAESITDIFFALDLNLRCTYWNKAAEKLTGISIKSAISSPLSALIPGQYGRDFEFIVRQALSSSEALAHSFCAEIKSVLHYFDADIYPSESGLSILARDITEKKRTADLQLAQEEMKVQLAQANELKILGLLTSGVAHEVRNPLNAISVVLEALFQEIGEKPELILYKEHIFTHVDRLTRLMQDLLELGKPIERSKITRIPIVSFVKEAVDLYKYSGHHERLLITVDGTDALETYISGDPLKLQQVFLNIFENANQHSPLDSVLNVTVFQDDSSCCIQIRDSGTGIKPEHLKHIFEPFFTTRRKGTGLGLAIVKHILEEHRGSIHIRNNENAPGSTVEIRLPQGQVILKNAAMCLEC